MNDIKIINSELETNYNETGSNALVVELEKAGRRYTLVEWVNCDDELESTDSHLSINQSEELVSIFGEYINEDEEWIKAWGGEFSDLAIDDFSFTAGFKFMQKQLDGHTA
jgi:hypothetical protein